jgi:hypothetical protein
MTGRRRTEAAVTREEKIERRMAAHIARLVRDEASELARLRKRREFLYEVGGLLILLSLLASVRTWWPTWVNPLLAASGGLACGLGVFYDTAANQWPVLRKFLDSEKLEQTVFRYEP